VLTAAALIGEYQRDEFAFVKKHQGKVFEISGTVKDFDYSFSGPHLHLEEVSPNAKFLCQERQPIAKAMPGQTAHLRGYCGVVGILRWAIVKVTGDPPPMFAAEDFANNIAMEAEASSKKLKGKWVILSGRITKIEKEGEVIYLTAPDKQPTILCRLATDSQTEKERNQSLRINQEVKVLGHCVLGGPELFGCDVLMPTP